MLDFKELVEAELLRDDHYEAFHEIGKLTEEALVRSQYRGLRVSDAGACNLALWAKVSGLLDVPISPRVRSSRLDIGVIYGVYFGLLFKRAAERLGHKVTLEHSVELVVDGVSIPGHLDIMLPELGHIKEIKTSYAFKPTKIADYHLKQVGSQYRGLQKQDPLKDWSASIVQIFPAVPVYAGEFIVETFLTREQLVQAGRDSYEEQLSQVKAIKSPYAPPQNAKEAWRCDGCGYGACPKNSIHKIVK